jgi:FKBP-type peptidyl-prolyl cis-trans isomerase FklB
MKKTILLTTVAAGVIALTSQVAMAHAGKGKSTLNMKNVSYAIGYNFGKTAKKQGLKIKPKAFTSGMRTAINGATPKMTEAQMKATMANFQKVMLAKMMAKQKKTANTDAKKSANYIDRISHMKGVKKIEDGLYYKVIKAGRGVKPTAADTVTVNYSGSLIGGKVFDSSYKRGKPATFKVGQVIKGWKTALQHMPQGSTWMLYIAPNLAYGKFAPPSIGANQALTFKVDLIKVTKPTHHEAPHKK